jgi:pimeloyl-ACP methyl ester carboxylesterase
MSAVNLGAPLETCTLEDGRTLAFGRYGALTNNAGVPFFYFNGTPSSRREAIMLSETACKLGITLIGVDRPGLGHSSFQEHRRLLDWPRDILALADHLDIHKFAVLGVSGGGPHVLACLHEISSDRLVAATTVSGMWPMKFGAAGMMLPTWLTFKMAAWSPWVAELALETFLGKAARSSDREALKEKMRANLGSLPTPPIDKECVEEFLENDVLTEAMIGGIQDAFRLSSRGAVRDFHIMGTEWEFDVANVDARRVTVWYGDLDANIPMSMVNRATKLMPGTKVNIFEGHGHLSLVLRHQEDILKELLARTQAEDVDD